MTGAFWDPFAPNENLEPARFPVVAPVPPPTEASGEAANEAPAPWPPLDEPTPEVRYMLFGEPYDPPAPAPAPPPPPWSATDEPTPMERYMLFGEPYEPPPVFETPSARTTDERFDPPAEIDGTPPEAGAPAAAWVPPEPSSSFDAPVDAAQAPFQDPPIFLPGEKPPTLAEITAPRMRVGRGLAMAAALHVAVLATALWLVRTHVPPPPPKGPVVQVVMETPPQGDTADAVPVPHLAPPARAKVAAPMLPPPPPPAPAAPPVATLADLPPPPPPPMPAAPARAPAPALAQGVRMPAPLIGAETVRVTQPATPDARNAPPYYPPVARALGEEGQVDLTVEVLASGQVAHVVVAKSSGYPRLDEAARQSLLGWRFHPAVKNGTAVASIFTYYVRYQLQ